MEQMHSLLKRQMRRYFGDRFRVPKEWQGFVDAVNEAYRESDIDREMLERSLELSSQELIQANSEMRAIFQAIPDLLFRLDSEGKILDYKVGASVDLLLQPKELLGKRIQNIPVKYVRDKFREAIRQVQEKKSIVSVEYSLTVQDQILFYEARLLPLLENQIIVIIRNITEHKRIEEALRKREEAQRFFSERLTHVLDTINELSKIKSFDELCRRSVELAIKRLGFDRVGLCFLSEDRQTVLGSYGTDETGHLRSEKHLKRPVQHTPTVKKLLENSEPVLFFEKEMLYNDKLHEVGIGNHAVARLWNGEKIIGIYAVDNLIHQNPITGEDMEILDIYGTAMGHLFTLKQAEGALEQAYAEVEKRVEGRTAELQREITERKRTEEALAQEQYLLQTLLDNLPDTIYFKDTDSRFIRISKSQVERFGLSEPAQVVGKTDFNFFTEEHARPAFEDEQRIMGTGQPLVGLEEKETWPDGSETWVTTTKMPLRDKKGQIVGTFGISTNITERKQIEERIRKLNEELELRVIERTTQLESVNKELKAFAYSVSHDLRAPLRAIDGYTNILVEDYGQSLDEEGKRVCAVICSETKRMGQIIDDLRSFSHISHAEMQVSPINMETLVYSVFNELTTPESRERIDFRVAPLPSAIGTLALIREAWMNLLSNAIKFSSKRERAVIEVGYQQYGQRIIYSVRDNGAGFDMQRAENLFTVFWRLHSKKEFEGTGVGLAIVQRLVHRHGGEVWAESQIDKGATFYFSLEAAK